MKYGSQLEFWRNFWLIYLFFSTLQESVEQSKINEDGVEEDQNTSLLDLYKTPTQFRTILLVALFW